MLSQIPVELSIGAFSLVGGFSAYIWNSQDKRISKLECDNDSFPFPQIKQDLAQMKTDIEWIKKFLIKQ